MNAGNDRERWPLVTMLAVVLAATAWSLIRPADYATWFFEMFLGGLGVVVLAATYRRFQFSALIYLVVAAHFVVLAAGAKYTYAQVPLGNWLKDALGLARNDFDRLGHFFQGVTPALVTREILLGLTPLARGWLVQMLSLSVALAFSAAYEILEWLWVIAFYPDQGPEWLGMQNDPWDTQWDMCMALVGAVLALLLLSRLQDRRGAGGRGAWRVRRKT